MPQHHGLDRFTPLRIHASTSLRIHGFTEAKLLTRGRGRLGSSRLAPAFLTKKEPRKRGSKGFVSLAQNGRYAQQRHIAGLASGRHRRFPRGIAPSPAEARFIWSFSSSDIIIAFKANPDLRISGPGNSLSILVLRTAVAGCAFPKTEMRPCRVVF